MALLPEEEDAFVEIVSQLRLVEPARYPFAVVAACVGFVIAGASAAALVGVSAVILVPFCVTFAVALTAGSLVLAQSHRHYRVRDAVDQH
jgi:hypothetical protein